MPPLQQTFTDLMKRQGVAPEKTAELWDEIKIRYSEEHRQYHTLAHLEAVLQWLQPIKKHLSDPDAVLLALYYHDIVYNVARADNEAASALLAADRLKAAKVPTATIAHCCQIIAATEAHEVSADNDCNYFIDADMAILGSSPDKYEKYAQQVRNEYSIYPDQLYRPGRRKVLEHILATGSIYKTDQFKGELEHQARENLARELLALQ